MTLNFTHNHGTSNVHLHVKFGDPKRNGSRDMNFFLLNFDVQMQGDASEPTVHEHRRVQKGIGLLLESGGKQFCSQMTCMIECLNEEDCVSTSIIPNNEGRVVCNLYATNNPTVPSDNHQVWTADMAHNESCPSGFERISCLGCYRLETTALNWDSADGHCDSLGTNIHLAG